MSYIRGYIPENFKFHLVLKIPVSSISVFNTETGLSVPNTKDLYFVLCDDGTKLVWKSNPVTFLSEAVYLKYNSRNNKVKISAYHNSAFYPTVINTTYSYTTDFSQTSVDLNITTSYKLDPNLMYCGIDYTIKTASSSDILMRILKPTTLITPGNTNPNDVVHGSFYDDGGELFSLNISKYKIMFIPHIDHSMDSQGLIQNTTEYTSSLAFFRDYINNVFPDNYIPPKENTYTDSNTIVVFVQHLDMLTKYFYSYCTNLNCGNCMGVCVNGAICSVTSDHKDQGDKLTCEHIEDSERNPLYIIFIIVIFLLILIDVYIMYSLYMKHNGTTFVPIKSPKSGDVEKTGQ